MPLTFNRPLSVSLVAALAFSLALPAYAADYSGAPAARAETYHGAPPLCDDEAILRAIEKRFRIQARNILDNPDLRIDEIANPHQHRLETETDSSPIGRRYCNGTARLSDGDSRQIWYLIEDGMGFASTGDNVEFCISGFDHWLVYNRWCNTVR